MKTVHVILPAGTDDPSRPSGGHAYNRRVCHGLAIAGWTVYEHPVAGTWPWPDSAAERELADSLGAVSDGALLLIDGLIASAAAHVVVPATSRLDVVVLVHMPLGEQFPQHRVDGARRRESQMLSAVRAVVTTSEWSRSRLLTRYALAPDSVHVAQPGAEPARTAPGTNLGTELLCVAVVAPHKGHDVLLAALAPLAERAWCCRFVGALDRDPDFVNQLRTQARASGIDARLDFAGPLTGVPLDDAYRRADALVLATHAESYGMVITEALAHGLPVIATAVGGLPEALGTTPDGRLPGLLVPPGDTNALSVALREWLADADLRGRLRDAAAERRTALAGWDETCALVGSALVAATAGQAHVGLCAP